MRLLPIAQCRPGDVVADTIRHADGRVVLRAGTILTESLLAQLERWHLQVLPVEWPGFEDIDPDPWLPESLLPELQRWMAREVRALSVKDTQEARALVQEVMDNLPAARRRAFELVSPHQGGSPAFTAWINTVGLAIQLAQRVAPSRAEEVGLAALWLGLAYPDRQRGEVRESDAAHVVELVEKLRQFPTVASTTIASLIQHHARWDGSGHPPLAGNKIYVGALIVGLAEALTYLLFRTDAEPVPVHEALEWVMGGADLEYPLNLVQALQHTLAPYPVGAVIRVGSEVAVVLANTVEWPARPRIRLLTGPERGREVHLASPQERGRVVTGFYEEREY
ncbi:MAG: phosphohydrolase [Firmicutes bacterium]|nr:phosphohydrolase [Alicyclobacillaceae bacterium]MCL6496309.1 phosphohydrolase [Bacillota bacterium]